MTKEISIDQASATVYVDPFNRRIRIDDYHGDLKAVLVIINQQISDWVEKLIVKAYASDLSFFMANGFSCEAFIKGYYAGKDMYFVTRYFSSDRQQSKKWMEEESILQEVLSNKGNSETPSLDEIRLATYVQAEELSNIYKEIFNVYPTPVGEKSHILKTMEEGTVYVYIESGGQLVSAASAEVNWKFRNAELTDCATRPQAAGKGYMKRLLFFLEQKLKAEGITCCYTLARAESISMNKAFAQLGYAYGGRLINNCYIYSGIEDMNVWYKS